MRITIELTLQHYDRFLSWCSPNSREHAVLKNGVIVRRPKGDRFERIMEIDCTVEDAKALLELAKQLCPIVVPDIRKALDTPRDC